MHNLKLLTKIAVLYYKDRLTHEEIAAQLGMSRQTVGRCIEASRQQGLVTIRINSPLLFATELESLLEKEFRLKEAVVVSPAVEGDEAVKEALGKAGAEFLERRISASDTLGVAWGSTVLEVGRQLKRTKCRGVTIVQLNGSMDVGRYSTRAEYMVNLYAEAFNAQMVTFSAPMLVDRPEILKSLVSDSRIAAALKTARRTNIALFGVGDVSEASSPYKVGYYDQKLLDSVQRDGAVGEICGRFYDAHGQPCSPKQDQRTLAIELENLKQKALSIAVSGSPHKVEAILGMLRGHYCNVLITDEETAKALLSKSGHLGEMPGGGPDS